jgi:hypothetical protein
LGSMQPLAGLSTPTSPESPLFTYATPASTTSSVPSTGGTTYSG